MRVSVSAFPLLRHEVICEVVIFEMKYSGVCNFWVSRTSACISLAKSDFGWEVGREVSVRRVLEAEHYASDIVTNLSVTLQNFGHDNG
jgi:hypothetical protein